jgi:hypothetical protein
VVILNCKTNNENTFCGDIVFDNANIIPILLGAASSEVVAMVAMWMVLMVKVSALKVLVPEVVPVWAKAG